MLERRDSAFFILWIVIGLSLLVLLAFQTISLVERIDAKVQPLREAEHYCLEMGYPEMSKSQGSYYCVRTVNGTDEVVAIDQLIGE